MDHKEANTILLVSHMAARKFLQTITTLQYLYMVDVIFFQWRKKGEDKYVVRKNISEEDPPPWMYVQGELFTRSRKVCLD